MEDPEKIFYTDRFFLIRSQINIQKSNAYQESEKDKMIETIEKFRIENLASKKSLNRFQEMPVKNNITRDWWFSSLISMATQKYTEHAKFSNFIIQELSKVQGISPIEEEKILKYYSKGLWVTAFQKINKGVRPKKN